MAHPIITVSTQFATSMPTTRSSPPR
jgi:hypothetical protein